MRIIPLCINVTGVGALSKLGVQIRLNNKQKSTYKTLIKSIRFSCNR
jgi:hypothetical protein